MAPPHGWKPTLVQRKKMSLASLGKPKSLSHRASIQRAKLGHPLSDVHRQMISDTLRKRKGLTAGEIKVKRRLQAQGYKVLRAGWPDFLAVKGCSIRFIEVKQPKGKRSRLRPTQIQTFQILERLGFRVEILFEPNK